MLNASSGCTCSSPIFATHPHRTRIFLPQSILQHFPSSCVVQTKVHCNLLSLRSEFEIVIAQGNPILLIDGGQARQTRFEKNVRGFNVLSFLDMKDGECLNGFEIRKLRFYRGNGQVNPLAHSSQTPCDHGIRNTSTQTPWFTQGVIYNALALS